MILSNREIERALSRGDLVIDPRPPRLKAHDLGPYDTTTVNLQLAGSLSIPRAGGPFTFDLRKGGIARFLHETCDHVEIDPAGGYALQPGAFALGETMDAWLCRFARGVKAWRPGLKAGVPSRDAV